MCLFHQFFDVWSKSTLMMLLVLAACGDSEEGTQQETDDGKQEFLLWH
ncbi:hypothetical protein [Gracilibacillus lacisalsi]|nr:hypothetical protein [Gracilibacillus lacisalsi]